MKIALIENKSDEFLNSRLRYALFLKNKGHEVIAILPDDEATQALQQVGIGVMSLGFDVRERSAKTVLTYIKRLRRIFKQERFDVIHFYRIQPNLLGTPAAYFSAKNAKIVNHITGLGIAFAKASFKLNVLSWITKKGYQMNDRRFKAQLIFQNEEDKTELGNRKTYTVVKGSAVNEDRFNPKVRTSAAIQEELSAQLEYGKTAIKLLYVSRLVRIKGLGELVQAVAQYNKTASQKVELFAAGWIDDQNPDSFTKEEIEQFEQIKGIHFLGRRSDIPQLLSFVDVGILPTYYREGTPRVLLEAMAMAKPIITTDMPGCNHLIPTGENGKLIEPKSTAAIIEALEWISQQDLKVLGEGSYKLYKKEFSEGVVYNQLLELYSAER